MTAHEVCRGYMETPLGKALASAENDALTGFWFIGQKYFPKNAEQWPIKQDYPIFASLQEWLNAYFAKKNPALTVACAPKGSPFQKAVWDILLRIPHGKFTTYGAIAVEMAKKMGRDFMSAQAVGGAVGHNPISVIIPCHRVIGADGGLTGYAGGVDKKAALLLLEGAPILAKR